jgi:hypothetical protein
MCSRLLSEEVRIRIYKNIFFPLVLHESHTWFPTLGVQGRLRAFQKRMLRRVFGPKRNRTWRELQNEEIQIFCSSPSIIRMVKSRRTRWVGHVARIEKKKNEDYLLVGKPAGEKPLGKPRRRWVDNIKIDLGEWYGLD